MLDRWRSLILFISLVLLLFAVPRPLFLEPMFAQGEESPMETEEQVFRSVVADFAIFSYLTGDVKYVRDSVYPEILRASTQEEAIDLLSKGFQKDLARDLACYYLAWDEGTEQLVLIPGDSIPTITAQDEAETEVIFRNDHQARLQRLFYNCYAEGDCYRYVIEAEKEGTQWKISSVSLDQIKEGKKFE